MAERQRTQRPPEQLEGPFLEMDLSTEIELLRSEEAYQRGHNAKTLARYPDFRIVLTAIRARDRIREHAAAGRISVQTVAGRLRMHVGKKLLDLPTGRLLVIDRAIPHDVEAVEDSAFLLTIAWPERIEHS